ncbi:glycosyltransferase family 61 protein [Viridothelium virens]|uniref:EGF domain-specific O-linked N-acetylglucosamine transferase n=1 Tax=Viridothelium virens TaxID=1048519 RepID=A0A6A6H8T9_VIRVR|nr:glycosyltransferase family 61 protein [Viridothelium virens]
MPFSPLHGSFLRNMVALGILFLILTLFTHLRSIGSISEINRISHAIISSSASLRSTPIASNGGDLDRHQADLPNPTTTQKQSLPLPSDYTFTNDVGWCERFMGVEYLYSFRDHHNPYCYSGASQLECFQIDFGDGKLQDPFCVADGIHLNKEKYFELSCDLRDESKREIAAFPKFMFGTGTKIILDTHFRIDNSIAKKSAVESLKCGSRNKKHGQRKTAILFKRDGGANMWHSLMEVFSYYLSMDILSMTKDDQGIPFFHRNDMEDLQVIWVDDKGPGPYAEIECYDRVIIPNPGASNPLWQGDWEPRRCTNSTLLETFRRRIYRQFGVAEADLEPKPEDGLTVTLIDRRQTRHLDNQDHYIKKLQERFPKLHIQTLDLWAISFEEQLRILRSTNILVGTHGAGLTGTIFIPPRSNVVEILPPNFWHKGFRNLAQLRGHRYFSAHAEERPGSDDWKGSSLFIEEDRFMEIMNIAVKSLYNTGHLNEDVN